MKAAVVKMRQLLLRLVVHLVEWQQLRIHRNAIKQQEKLLRKILQFYGQTEMGRAFQLDTITSSLDFSRRVATRSAEDYLPWWERVRNENKPGTVHPQALKYMTKSAGTTSVSKHIPCPPQQLTNYQRFNYHCMFHALKELNDYTLLDHFILVTTSSGLEQHPASGIISGYGSGIATLHAPEVGKRCIRPTESIMALTDWDDKIQKTIAEAYPLDIRAITGMPIAMVDLLEKLLAYAARQGKPATSAKDVWPNLVVYTYSGTPLGVYEEKIRRMLGDDVKIFEVYSATECPMAYQYKFDRAGLLLDLTTAYYEFEPVTAGNSSGCRRLRLHEVQTGVPYNMVFTTIGGLFAYAPGDRVEFISTRPYVLRFAGRSKDELNLCNEQFRLDWVSAVVEATCHQFDAVIEFFLVCPQPMAEGSNRAGHQWCIEFSKPPGDSEAFLEALDRALQARAEGYRLFRTSELLAAPALYLLKPGVVAQFSHEHLVLGVGKLPQIHNNRTLPELLMAFDQRFAK